MKAFQIVFNVTTSYLASITVPGEDENDARARFLSTVQDPADIEITSCTDVGESQEFKAMIAERFSSVLEQEKLYAQWLSEASDETADAENTTNAPKTVN